MGTGCYEGESLTPRKTKPEALLWEAAQKVPVLACIKVPKALQSSEVPEPATVVQDGFFIWVYNGLWGRVSTAAKAGEGRMGLVAPQAPGRSSA